VTVNFTLTRKGEKEPTTMQKVDEELCQLLNQPVSDIWVIGWFNCVGLGLACGKTWSQLREIFEGSQYISVIDYLEKNFEVNTWYEPKH